MTSKEVLNYIKKQMPSKAIDLRQFNKRDFVEVVYCPTFESKPKTFRGKILKIKENNHISTVAVRSISDDIRNTVEIIIPVYRKDVKLTLIRSSARR